jgi:RluA family pseudouridine synthase
MKIKLQELILWEDERLLVVNKPPGLLSLPDGYDPDLPHVGGILAPAIGPLWIVHRLDKETSGLMILARCPDTHRALNQQFASRKVFKSYHALVVGNPLWEQKTIRLPLQPDGDRRHRTRVNPQLGKPSLTRARVMQRYGQFALVEAIPHTGRPHQVRAHLAALDHPVAVDGLYGAGQPVLLSQFKTDYRPGRRPERPMLDRLGLHAHQISFDHPDTGQRVAFNAPYPQDLRVTLRQLGKYGRP